MAVLADMLYALMSPRDFSNFPGCNERPEDLVPHMIATDTLITCSLCESAITKMVASQHQPMLRCLEKVIYGATGPPRCYREEQAHASTIAEQYHYMDWIDLLRRYEKCNETPEDLMTHMIAADVLSLCVLCEPVIEERMGQGSPSIGMCIEDIVYEAAEPPLRCRKREERLETVYHG